MYHNTFMFSEYNHNHNHNEYSPVRKPCCVILKVEENEQGMFLFMGIKSAYYGKVRIVVPRDSMVIMS